MALAGSDVGVVLSLVSRRCLARRVPKSDLLEEVLMLGGRERLRHHIGRVLLGTDVGQANKPSFNLVPNCVIPDIDIFGSLVKLIVGSKLHSPLGVRKDDLWRHERAWMHLLEEFP